MKIDLMDEIKETTNALYPETKEQMGTGYKVEYANVVKEQYIKELWDIENTFDLYTRCREKDEPALKEILINFLLED